MKDIIGPVTISSREKLAYDIETQAEGDIKWAMKKYRIESMGWIQLAPNRKQRRTFVYVVMNWFRHIKQKIS
jgi:hypothetical protein